MGIGGKKRELLTKEVVLEKISEMDIFRYYMPNAWSPGIITNSPFRKDTHPSFIIGIVEDNKLRYIDFAEDKYRGDCFQFVKDLYNLRNIDDVLKLIDKDFKLGITDISISRPRRNLSTVKKVKHKKYVKIDVSTKSFTKEELAYWNEYYLDLKDLKENNVFSINRLYLNGSLIYLPPTQLVFGYRYDDRWKIYRPLGEREEKWFPNNVPISVMEGKHLIKDAPFAFITKSKKDFMVVKKLIQHTCAVQNEGIACFNKENVKFLKDNSKRQVLSFDSDGPGVKSSLEITKQFDFDYCNVPKKFLNNKVKDWSDLAKFKGMSYLEFYFKRKKLI